MSARRDLGDDVVPARRGLPMRFGAVFTDGRSLKTDISVDVAEWVSAEGRDG